MNNGTGGISPEQVNTDQLDELYEIMESNGYAKLAALLEVLDLELLDNGDDMKITPTPLRYAEMPEQAQAQVLFMDGHEEVWRVEFDDVNQVVLFDGNGKAYHKLTELRPTANTHPSSHIIEITLVLSHSIIKF